jgi:hypothetical protein
MTCSRGARSRGQRLLRYSRPVGPPKPALEFYRELAVQLGHCLPVGALAAHLIACPGEDIPCKAG